MINGNFKTSYREDIKIFKTRFVRFWFALFVVGVVVFPLVADRYLTYILNITGITIIAAIGLNILVGYTGLISLGHAAFIGIGAYTSAILTGQLHISFWLAMPLSGIVAALSGVVVAIPSLRLKGFYVAVTTFAFGYIVNHVIVHWQSLTHGPDGLHLNPPNLFGIIFNTDVKFYYLIFFMVFLATAFAKNLFRTRVGRAFIAIRDRDIAAEVIGIHLAKYKILSFAICSFYAGIAGSLFAHYMTFITYEHFTVMHSIEYLTMIIVGGLGSTLGTVYGVPFIVLIPEGLRILTDVYRQTFPLLTTRFAELKVIIYGLVMVLFLLYEPTGLYGRWRKIKTYWINWPLRY